MSALAIQLVIAIALALGGFAGGIKWQVGIVAARDLQAQQARESDARQQYKFNDQAAGKHAGALATLNTQLGNAREKIADLSGRACLSGDTVGVLNATGVVDVPAAAGNPAGAAPAAAASADDRTASDTDVAGYIALCRTEYAKVSGQLNEILDIEERRYPPGASP